MSRVRIRLTLQSRNSEEVVGWVLDQGRFGDGDADADADGRGQAEGDHVGDEREESRVVGGKLQPHAEGDDELMTGDGYNIIIIRQLSYQYHQVVKNQNTGRLLSK